MTYHELIARIPVARFFSELGNGGEASNACVFIQSLDYWAEGSPRETSDWQICDAMDWLPTSHTQPDPFPTPTGDVPLSANEVREMRLAVAKLATTATRHLATPRLSSGPHDFTIAAKGALLFALRAMVMEIVCAQPGPWHLCVDHYLSGRWPCGLLPSGKVVVY